jgi:putative ABC transport system ATP-binding protein
MAETIVETRNLGKVYKTNGTKVEALKGVNLKLDQGEMVAVMGPSGCGKSTLLHLLGGLDTPTTGEVLIQNQRIDQMSESRRAVMRRQQIGFVFQAFNLIGNLSVADNIELPALVAGQSAPQARAQRERLLAELGILDKHARSPSQLSGGQRQRVALARAMINLLEISIPRPPLKSSIFCKTPTPMARRSCW